MQCIRELDPFFKCFYFFGQTAYIPSKVKHIKRLLIRSMFIKLIYIAVALAYVIGNSVNEVYKLKTFNKYVMRNADIQVFLMTNLLLYKIRVAIFISAYL